MAFPALRLGVVLYLLKNDYRQTQIGKIEWGVFGRRVFQIAIFVPKPDVAIASEVLILSKNSLAITDFHAKKTQHVQLFENPLPGTLPFAILKQIILEFIAKLPLTQKLKRSETI